ncbi:MAG TPA: 5'-3' exonuclease H3TH domain-containing protein [Dehalococcoidia bacterium]
MEIYLLDGTYELFRYFFALPQHKTRDGIEVGATRGVLSTVLSMFEAGTTHIGVATDHVVESFRNGLWPGYKSSAGMDPLILSQFPLIEEGLQAMGVRVWPMVDLEADDGLASAAAVAAATPEVELTYICSPDKDLGQCVVDGRVVQLDRRARKITDSAGVRAKFGVGPESIADYLALVGDSSDGFPGLPGWGAKTAATVLERFIHIEDIPERSADWGLPLRNAAVLAQTLVQQRHLAALFKDLATVRTNAPTFEIPEELRWRGPTSEFDAFCRRTDAGNLPRRARELADAAVPH